MSKRPIPADFAEYARQPLPSLRARYGAGLTTLQSWRKAIGWQEADSRAAMASNSGAPRRARPDDFEQFQEGKPVRALEAHYRCSNAVITRWLHEIGVHRKPSANKRTGEEELKLTKLVVPTPLPRRAKASTFIKTATPDRPHIDTTRAGLAAEFLRHFGPVRRCNEIGQYDPMGNRWRRGTSSLLLNANEIIERALRLGWNDPLVRSAA